MKFTKLLKKNQEILFFKNGMFIGLYAASFDIVFQIERVGTDIDLTINNYGFMGMWVNSYQVKDENGVIIEAVDYRELPSYKAGDEIESK